MKNTVTRLPYLYRDAANWKAEGVIYLSGILDGRAVAAIASKLGGGDAFIPGDLGLGIPELQGHLDSFPSEADHVFHEFEFAERTFLPAAPEGESAIDLAAFLAAFAAIPDANGWDVDAAMARLGIPS